MKNLFSKQNIFILGPLILVMFLDLIFTSVGQSTSYWRDSTIVNEANPLARALLVKHYAYFLLGSFVYGLIIMFLLAKLKRPFNIMLGIGVFISHLFGSASWTPEVFDKITGNYEYEMYWYLLSGYFIIIAVICGFFVNKWLETKKLI